ncbi:GntR family transcriptional regulator [Siccirubricoccus sp. KC 17139]|uniref:GntR family transcriptional regulator n=1 Tax=Siccirubricoccus soli TaxID=2899147 RepID=A0ABT1DCI5_9PROT|nr:GntR family transcriptional regulator [Siccirubricoccus soli]MCO6419651.1 GntR family transcriptional regulator [Siccirubricoccus soli]MCP2685786.1 GntR family transcriptional regulator [Siccirubricoccus soli]
MREATSYPKQDRAPQVATGDSTLTEQAYRAIEEAIVTLDLRPGEAVSEAQLSARFQFGRTPVREALQRLAREKLVRILPRRGIVVAPVDVREQLRLLEVRREVERLIARLAARRADAAERRHFRAVAERMEQAAASNDGTAFLSADRALNLLVLEAARNEFAAAAMALMHGLSRRFWFIHWQRNADLPRSAVAHAALATAIAEGDAEGAARASDALLDYIEAFTRATVGPEP